MVAVGCTGGSGAEIRFDSGLAPNPTASIELRSVELVSGLVVDVFGPSEAFDGLPNSPTAAQLCEDFTISLTAIFDQNQEPVAYAASATWRPMEGTSDPSLSQGLVGYLAPIFPDYEIPSQQNFGGVESNPIAITNLALTSGNTGNDQHPDAQAVYHYRTRAPMAVFNHTSSGEHRAFPRTWHDAAGAAAGPGVEVWSRYIEGAEMLAQCDGYSEVIAKTMNLSVVEDLATCGDIMAWPYSVAAPTTDMANGLQCLTPAQGFGVTLSPLTRNDFGTTVECPRPPEAQFEYICFGQSGS